MTTLPTRRTAIQSGLLAAAGFSLSPQWLFAQKAAVANRMTLGFSTYGMKTLSLAKALDVIAEVGFEAVEICVRPEWDSSPAKMTPDRRAATREQLAKHGLKLTALMEHLPPAATEADHKLHLMRLKGVYELARDLGAGQPPLMQTVLGDGSWDTLKNLFRDRVADWVKLGQEHGVVTCIKPHRGGAMSRPSEAIWLIQQLDNSKWLKIVYDYSHYIYRDIPLVESLTEALPYVAHVAVKDTIQKDGKTSFVLPGEAGTIDYSTLFAQLKAGGYRGDLSCEVSGMVSNKPDYDPIAATKTCFRNLDPVFRKVVG